MTESMPKLTRGRPPKTEDAKAVREQITLTPSALALIDAQPGPRSALIERLIADRYG